MIPSLSIQQGALAVGKIDDYLVKNQISKRYNKWLDRYSKKPNEHDDSFLFGNLVQSMFSGGMKGEVVDKWMPKMNEAFHGWDVFRISKLSEDDIEDLIKSHRVIANRPKLMAIIDNAKLVVNIISTYGTFGKYLTSSDDINRLKNDLNQFKYIKEITSEDFLRNIGYDTSKPDRHLIRWLTRMQIIDESTALDQVLKTIYSISEIAKISRARFDSAIYLFCADRRDVLDSAGICGNKPQCGMCPIQDVCPSKSSPQSTTKLRSVKPKAKHMDKPTSKSPISNSDPLSVWNTTYRGKTPDEVKIISAV